MGLVGLFSSLAGLVSLGSGVVLSGTKVAWLAVRRIERLMFENIDFP